MKVVWRRRRFCYYVSLFMQTKKKLLSTIEEIKKKKQNLDSKCSSRQLETTQ